MMMPPYTAYRRDAPDAKTMARSHPVSSQRPSFPKGAHVSLRSYPRRKRHPRDLAPPNLRPFQLPKTLSDVNFLDFPITPAAWGLDLSFLPPMLWE